MISAFLATIAISEAPLLHERIHGMQGAQHDCAATILSSGGVELCSCVIIFAAPGLAPELYTFSSLAGPPALAPLDFLLLEHAPPAQS